MSSDNASDIDNSPIPDCEGMDRDGWFGKVLLARHTDGSDFANVIITTTNPNACIDGDNRLCPDDVGIVVLKVYNGDPDIGDACLRWPIRRLLYHGATSYVSVCDHARKRSAIEAE